MAVGELCIGGASVARGYLNCHNQSKFLNINGCRYYRTGDLVRRITNSMNKNLIQFLGRKDDLIKINGIQIDPIEIQNLINQIISKTIKNLCLINVFVTAETNKKNEQKELVAFITIKIKENKNFLCDSINNSIETNYNQKNESIISLKKLSNEEIINLKNKLKKFLPKNCIPLYFIFIDQFPKTINGKIDRENLSLLFEQWINNSDHMFESNEIIKLDLTQIKFYKILANIWEKILFIKIHNQTNNEFLIKNFNFFESGGHSLLLFKLKHEISNKFPVNLLLTF